jgi:hypothetical protein
MLTPAGCAQAPRASDAPAAPPALQSAAPPTPETLDQRKAALLKECGEGFEVRETDHWLIVYKADPKWVDSAAKMLERTHDLYFEQFGKAGFELQPLRQKLVCVLIGKQEDFAKYLDALRQATGRPPPTEPQPAGQEPRARQAPVGLGSYSGQTNRIQLCDIHSIPRNPNRPVSDARLDLENVARISHEAAHQLSFNTGLLKPQTGYPMWLGEGLAANFEFTDADKPFGPLTANLSPRAGRLRQLFAEGQIASIKSMVTLSPSASRQPDNKGPTYVQGWGLFRFLITERPKQLKQYLADLAARPRSPRNAAEALAAFEAAFGPVDDIEKDWQQFFKRLGPPGTGQPAPASPPDQPPAGP